MFQSERPSLLAVSLTRKNDVLGDGKEDSRWQTHTILGQHLLQRTPRESSTQDDTGTITNKSENDNGIANILVRVYTYLLLSQLPTARKLVKNS